MATRIYHAIKGSASVTEAEIMALSWAIPSILQDIVNNDDPKDRQRQLLIVASFITGYSHNPNIRAPILQEWERATCEQAESFMALQDIIL
jgi:hypothetical protein